MAIRIKLKPKWRSYFTPGDRSSSSHEIPNTFGAEYAQLVAYYPGNSPGKGRYKLLMEVSPEQAQATAREGYQVEGGKEVWFIGEANVEDMSDYVFDADDWKPASRGSVRGSMVPTKATTVDESWLQEAKTIARQLLR